MRSIGFLLFMLGLGLALPAQDDDKVLLHDEFTQYHPYWTQLDSSRAKVRNGSLFLQQARPTGTLFFLLEQYLSIRSNFVIETSLTFAPHTPSGELGLIWSSTRSRDDYYVLRIRPDGYLAVDAVADGKVHTLRGWTRSRKLKKAGKENVIRLRKQRYVLYVEVNGREALKLDFPPLQGVYQGFCLSGRMAVQVAYYRIEHPPLERLLVDDMHVQAERFPLDTPICQPFYDEITPMRSERGQRLFFARADTSSHLRATELVLSRVENGRLGLPLPVTGLPPADRQALIQLDLMADTALLATHSSGQADQLFPLQQIADSAWTATDPLDLPELPPQRHPITWFVPDDRSYLLFAAELPGGFGHRDLWVSERRGSGWSKPKNLGAKVNSFGDEMTPYLDSETRQLYFASNGQPGYGGLDIYRCASLGDAWTHWSHPANLGPGINGLADEWYYRPLRQQPRRAYLSAQDSVGGDFDLYQVRIPADLTEQRLARIQGRIYNRKTRQPIPQSTLIVARIEREADSLHLLHELPLDSIDYDLLVHFGESYQLYAVKPGYYSVSDTLNLRPTKSYRVIRRDLYLVPIEAGSTITLEKVYFHRASPELLPESFPELGQLYETMRQNPGLEIEIRGHTDNIGEESVLKSLSEARAARVRRYLIERGISPARVSSRGLGSTQPVVSNEDPATRPLNRRVEFRVIKL